MKNYFTIIPGIKQLKNYFVSLKYKLTNRSLLVGFNCELKKVKFGHHNSLGDNCSINNASIGNYTYISSGTKINNSQVGSFCSIGSNCLIGLGKHPVDEFISTHPIFYSTLKQCGTTFSLTNCYAEFETISIGNDVWIGANAIILDGVSIGNGAIIGAGAIVTADVNPYEVVAGVPARFIKKRFDDNTIAQLELIQWWSKPEEWIKENSKYFLEKETFLSHFKSI